MKTYNENYNEFTYLNSLTTLNFDERVKELKVLKNEELMLSVFTGYDRKNDRFPIEINGVKLSMTYNEVQKWNKKNNTKFRLLYPEDGYDYMVSKFNKYLELQTSGDLTVNKIRELMKDADSVREFINVKQGEMNVQSRTIR